MMKNLFFITIISLILMMVFEYVPRFVWVYPLASVVFETLYMIFLSGDIIFAVLPVPTKAGILIMGSVVSLIIDYMIVTPILILIWGE